VRASDPDPAPRTLVAGIGNIFCGDDGFGVVVAQRLAPRPPPGVRVRDFGTRALDLAYELLDGYERVILVDAAPRGRPPGTLCVLEPDPDDLSLPSGRPAAGHDLGVIGALALARGLGAPFRAVWVVGCEPAAVPAEAEVAPGLSAPVAAAVEEAVRVIAELVRE